MTDSDTSNLGFENPSNWKELENSINCMQLIPTTKGSYETGCLISNSSNYDEDVIKAVNEDDCTQQLLSFVKEEVKVALYKYAPESMKRLLKKEEVQCNALEETNEDEIGFWGRLWNSVKNFFYNLKEAIKGFWKWISEFFKKILDTIKEAILKIFQRVGELMMRFYSCVNEANEKGAKMVTDLLSNMIEKALYSCMGALVFKAHSM